MSGMFQNCKALTALEIRWFTFRSGVAVTNILTGCGNLTVTVKDAATADWLRENTVVPASVTFTYPNAPASMSLEYAEESKALTGYSLNS
jgi:hypothetical protein